MNIRSLSRGGAPAACLLSRSSGSSVDQIASGMSRRNAMISPRKVSLMENDHQHFMNSSTRPDTSNNRERMNYPKFRAMGLCVATAVVGGDCKNIVGAHLKQGGMR